MLREFIVLYKPVDSKKEEVTPATMNGYIQGISRYLTSEKYDCDIGKHPLFRDRDEGIYCVMENNFAEQQSRGLVKKPHNYLPLHDLLSVLDHKICTSDWASGYLNRLFIVVGVFLGVRTTAMHNITVSQFKSSMYNGETVLLFTPIMGSAQGSSKNYANGLANLKHSVETIPIWNKDLLSGRVNMYKFIKEYLDLRKKAGIKSDIFFWD